MKKGILWLCLMALLLCGCAGKKPEPVAVEPGFTEPMPPEVMIRPEKMEMEIMLEGMPEVVPVTLYRNDTYSLYIPDGDWSMTVLSDGATQWTSLYNDRVKLTIRTLSGVDEAQARQAVLEEYPGFTVGEDVGTEFVATEATGQEYLSVRLVPMAGGFLTVTWTYSLEAAEGFGVRIGYMVDTLLLEQK